MEKKPIDFNGLFDSLGDIVTSVGTYWGKNTGTTDLQQQQILLEQQAQQSNQQLIKLAIYAALGITVLFFALKYFKK